MRVCPLIAPLTGLAAVTVASIASANITTSYISSSQYSFKMTKVPDFDQRRNGLPLNGSVHCAPTSAINWMAYIANHGWSSLAPGPGDWKQPALYDTATTNILGMGLLMNTSSIGSKMPNIVAGTKAWLSQSAVGGGFVVVAQWDAGFTWTLFDDLAEQALLKRLVMVRIGWYYQQTSTPGTYTRDGGHITCMTRALRDGPNRILGMNDPGTADQDLDAQSPFTREDYVVVTQNITILPSTGSGIFRPTSRLNGYAPGRVDGYVAIIPLFGLTTSPDELSINFDALTPIGSNGPSSTSLPVGALIRDLAIAHDARSAYSLTKISAGQQLSVITRHRFLTGALENITTVAGDIGSIAVGRKGPIYYTLGNTLSCRDVINPNAPLQTVTAPGPLAALIFSDTDDQAVALDVVNKRLYRYPESLVSDAGVPASPVIVNLPRSLSFSGTPRLAINPATGRTFIATSASNSILEVIDIPGAPPIVNAIVLPGVGSIQSLQFDDIGRIFVCDGSVKGFLAPAGGGGGTATPLPASASPFIGKASPKFFRIATSRHNYDPATMDLPGQEDDVLPFESTPPIPDCFADLNGDDKVDGTDLGALLQAWGTIGFSDADLNSDGIVDGIDLGLLLQNWGACPS